MSTSIQFYTLAPSPHLVEVLNTLHGQSGVNLHVVYEKMWLDERSWGLHAGNAPHTYLRSWDVTGKGQHWSSAIGEVARRSEADIVIVNTSYVSLNTYMLTRILRRRNIPFVLWAERVSRLSNPVVKCLRKSFIRWILKRAAGFVGSTQATVRFYRNALGYRGPATWVPYHRDLDPFLKLPLTTEVPDKVTFLFLGGLVRGKGIDTVLHAISRVERPAELLIAGEGPEREQLQKIAAQCHSHHTIRFIGALAYEEVCEVTREADVLLFPSRHDGFGMVTMEALAAGLPVIASDAVMSAREYIQTGKNGWILPVNDIAEWAHQINAVIEHRTRLPEWSCAARETIYSSYQVDQDVDRLVRFLEGRVPTEKRKSHTHVKEQESV